MNEDNRRALALMAQELSNFDGEPLENQGYMDGYQGEAWEQEMGLVGAELASFKGVQNKLKGRLGALAAKKTARVFKLKVVNGGTEDQTFYLNPSYKVAITDDGHPLSGKGIEGGSLTFVGAPSSGGNALVNFYQHVLHNPQILVALKVASTLETQMDESMSIEYLDPFKSQPEARPLFLSTEVSESDFNAKRVTINEPMPFDNQTQMIFPVVAQSTLTLTLFFGPEINISRMLRRAGYNSL